MYILVRLHPRTVIYTISNPTSFEEKIELDASHGDAEIAVSLEVSEVVIPAGGQVDVSITITASEGAESANHILQVNATVIEHNGVPPANVVSDSEDIAWRIKIQCI